MDLQYYFLIAIILKLVLFVVVAAYIEKIKKNLDAQQKTLEEIKNLIAEKEGGNSEKNNM